MKEQRDDPTLRALYSQVLLADQVESAACGYFLQDSLLVRKWVPQGNCFVGDEIAQIVLLLREGPLYFRLLMMVWQVILGYEKLLTEF